MKWLAIPFILLAVFGIPVFVVAVLAALDESWFDGWTIFHLIWPPALWAFLFWSWRAAKPRRSS